MEARIRKVVLKMSLDERINEEEKIFNDYYEKYEQEYNKRNHIRKETDRQPQEDLWIELMEKYYEDNEEDTRNINFIISDVKKHSGFDKVKQVYYSSLCNGKGVRKLRVKMETQFQLDLLTSIENKDKVLFDSLFKDVKMWIKAKYIELYRNRMHY